MDRKERLRELILDTAAIRLDFPVTDSDIEEMARELDLIPNTHWYWDTFRECYLLCLYGNSDVNNKKDMHWLEPARGCDRIKKLCEEFIFPMTNVKPRIIVIRTMPGMKMRLHTDCYIDQIGKLEPKLRLVVKGRKGNPLYYVNEQGEKIHIPDEWRAYMMSGATLHGMDNNNEEKYTLCWGDPWVGDDLGNEAFVDYMETQFMLYGDELISISKLGNVNHAAGIKDPRKERIYSWDEWNRDKKD